MQLSDGIIEEVLGKLGSLLNTEEIVCPNKKMHADINKLRLRLRMVGKYCLNNIDHVAPYVERQLYFQAFRRLYNAAGEFLQALFIARYKYPIAYDKWIKEQLVEILGFPDLYPRFVDLLSIKDFASSKMKEKADSLLHMYNEYCVKNILSNKTDAGDGFQSRVNGDVRFI